MEPRDLLRIKGLTKAMNPTDARFEERWAAVTAEYSGWCADLGALTSPVNRRLEFLRMLREKFSELDLLSNRRLVDSILRDALAIGAKCQGFTPEGVHSELTVIDRDLSPRGGIVYTLETPDGRRFSHETFD